MIWIFKNLANKILKVNILPKSFSDPNPVHLLLEKRVRVIDGD